MTQMPSRLVGIVSAAALPATVAGIMAALDRWDWPVFAIVAILSVPLYVVGRDGARAAPPGRDHDPTLQRNVTRGG